MSKSGKDEMNVARLNLYLRVYAWGVLVLYGFLLHFYLTELRRGGIGERLLGMAGVLAIFCFCLYLIVRTHGVYRWNDEEIQYATLLGKRSMRWEEIVRFDVRRFSGGWARTVLCDALDKRLTVYTYLMPENSPLHPVLREKLAHLEEAVAKEIEGLEEAYFPLGIRELPGGTFIVRGDRLIHQRGRKSREILLTEIQQVNQSSIFGDLGEPTSEVTELIPSTGAPLRIPSQTKGYDRLVAYIRARTKNATWVSSDRPVPESGPARTADARGKLGSSYRRMTAPLETASFVFMIVMGLLLARFVLTRSGPEEEPSLIWYRVVDFVLLALFIVATAWWLVRHRDEIKEARSRRKARMDKHDSPNRSESHNEDSG